MNRHELGKNFLEHYGVKGMKWGVRKRRKAQPSEDFLETAGLRRRKPEELSTAELRRLNERLNLEQNYARMTPKRGERAHRAVNSVLAAGATVNAVIAFNRSPAGQAVRRAITKK